MSSKYNKRRKSGSGNERSGCCGSKDKNEIDETAGVSAVVCKKSMVIIFNIMFFIVGAGLCAFAIYTIKSKHDYVSLLTSALFQTSTYMLIISGSAITITAVVGIVGAWIGSKKVLIVYVLLLVIILICQILAGVLALTYRATLKKTLESDLKTLITDQYKQPGYNKKSESLDQLQIRFKCCGALNYHDWKNSSYILQQNKNSTTQERNVVAESCCKTPSALCAVRDHPSNINYRGCAEALENYIKDYILALGIVGFSLCIFQLIGILFAVLLSLQLDKSKDDYRKIRTNDN